MTATERAQEIGNEIAAWANRSARDYNKYEYGLDEDTQAELVKRIASALTAHAQDAAEDMRERDVAALTELSQNVYAQALDAPKDKGHVLAVQAQGVDMALRTLRALPLTVSPEGK